MTSLDSTVMDMTLGVKGFITNNVEFEMIKCRDSDGFVYYDQVQHIYGSVSKDFDDNLCPICKIKCPFYDKTSSDRKWRHNDNSAQSKVYIHTVKRRVTCPKHGVITADVPWALHNSRFTLSFEINVLLEYKLTKTKKAVCDKMRISWDSVKRIKNRVIPFVTYGVSIYDNLTYIGIDETSYKKGKKYVTVVINHETNSIIWVGLGTGKQVLSEFFNQLSPAQRASIKAVTADGARWIDGCLNEYLDDYTRCVDPFHVVSWVMEAIDELRKAAWRKANWAVKNQAEKVTVKKGRPSKDDEEAHKLKELKANATRIKNSSKLLAKSAENLTDADKMELERLFKADKRLQQGYFLKELIRKVFKLANQKKHDDALKVLNDFIYRTTHSRFVKFKDLGEKIKRHRENIMNTVKTGLSNSRVEANNNKIKLLLRSAYGFWNYDNMMEAIKYHCSNDGYYALKAHKYLEKNKMIQQIEGNI